MKLDTKDIIKKKLLDTQENVRDFQMLAEKIEDEEVYKTFKNYADIAAMQANRLQSLLGKYE